MGSKRVYRGGSGPEISYGWPGTADEWKAWARGCLMTVVILIAYLAFLYGLWRLLKGAIAMATHSSLT
jgi:hypothetical protein